MSSSAALGEGWVARANAEATGGATKQVPNHSARRTISAALDDRANADTVSPASVQKAKYARYAPTSVAALALGVTIDGRR